MKYKLVLILILVLGFVLRAVDINNNPPALYGDELTIGYDSYSLLKTGRDQLGNIFPLTFQMGAGRPAGYVYFSLPFVALFGPSALGVRGLSVLSGIGIIILLYFIGRRLFSEKAGLAAAFIAAISPWDISLSRGGFEAHLALFFVLLGTYLFLLGKAKPLAYIFSAIFFGLTLHTYPTYKLVLPLFLVLLVWFGGYLRRVHFLVAVAVLILFAFAAATQTFKGGSEERFGSINVFSNQEIKSQIEQKINYERNTSNLPTSILKFFHNKPVEYLKVIGENYLQNFSLDFLFIHGDRNPRHNMGTTGGFYLVEIILISVGLFASWQRNKKALTFLIVWLVIAPIPTSLVDKPHALRSAFMLPPLLIFSGMGLVTFWEMRKRAILIILGVLFLVQFLFFAQKLYFLAPNEYSRFWSYPAKLASEMARENRKHYNYVVISDRIDNVEFAYPVYAQIEPGMVISQNQQRSQLGKYNFKKFDNVYVGFLPDGEAEKLLEDLDGSVLYIADITKRQNIEGVEVLKGLDGLEVLIIKKKEL